MLIIKYTFHRLRLASAVQCFISNEWWKIYFPFAEGKSFNCIPQLRRVFILSFHHAPSHELCNGCRWKNVRLHKWRATEWRRNIMRCLSSCNITSFGTCMQDPPGSAFHVKIHFPRFFLRKKKLIKTVQPVWSFHFHSRLDRGSTLKRKKGSTDLLHIPPDACATRESPEQSERKNWFIAQQWENFSTKI